MIMDIKVDKIFPNPNQPRKDFDQDKLEELAMSIKEYGVVEPIVVTPRNGSYMIIAGERRFRASLLAKTPKIPARVIKADDALIEELALLENIQRQDLNCIEEARAYKSLIDRGMTKEELASKLGFKQTWRIDWYLSILKLAPEYQQLVVNGKLSTFHAYEMSRIPSSKQTIVLKKILSGELNTYNKLRSFVDGIIAIENQKDIFQLEQLSEDERKSITTFDSALKAIEKFITEEHNKFNYLRKAGFRAEIKPERIDLIIRALQKIRKNILAGDGLKKAYQKGDA